MTPPDAHAEDRPGLSIVVPCFNEEAGLDELHTRVSAVARATVDSDYEIVLVNDGSRDGTWDAICRLADSDPAVVGIDLSRNHGHQAALSAGLSLARGERIFILDADLQDPPELLPRMMALIEDGADVVYGQRLDRDGETRFKRASASLFYRLLAQLVDVEIPLDTGDFRLMTRRALEVLNSMPEQHRFVRGMVAWVGFRQVALPYQRAARHTGETKYSLAKMIRFALDAVTSFSILPLRLASLLGFVFGAMALAMVAYTIGVWAAGGTVTGWPSLMIAILVLGSAQLIVLGIMGEYLGRMFVETKQRPLFVISQIKSQTRPQAAPAVASPRQYLPAVAGAGAASASPLNAGRVT